jgi:hypothetical protein
MPGEPAEPLHALADEVVAAFDDFRATPTPADIARRNPAGMTARQRELFDRWGYPYVLDEFRFHLTLTDRIAPDDQAAVEAVLTDWFGASIGATIPVDALAIFREDAPGAPFMLHSVHPLAPTPQAGTNPISVPATQAEGIR